MSRSITMQEFANWAKEKRPDIELLSDYVKSKEHVLCRCKKCGHEWLITPNSLRRGKGCPKCGIIKRSISHSNVSKEEFFSLMQNRDDITIVGEYHGSKEGIMVKCNNCQFEWMPSPHNLKSGSRCPKCVGVYSPSPDEFIEWLSENRPNMQALSPYISSNKKIKIRCKICNNEWEVKPNSIKNGSGCPNCARGQTSFVEQYIRSSMEMVFGKMNICHRDKKAIGKEVDIYIPSCKIGIEYGSWYWHKKRIHVDEQKRMIAKNSGIKLITIYDDYNEENTVSSDIITYPFSLGQNEYRYDLRHLIIRLLNECGVSYSFSSVEWNQIEDESAYNAQKTNTTQFIKEIKKINPNIAILGEYKNSSSLLHVKCCICGYEWDSKPIYLKQGYGCKKCGNTYSPTPQEFSKKIADFRSDITLLEPYVNNKTKIMVKCNQCEREWKVVPYSLLTTRKCSVCAGNYSPTTEEFIYKMKEINPGIEVLGEYKNNKSHIECKCLNCNYIWMPTPHDLVGGSGCPICSRKQRLNKKSRNNKQKNES